MYLATDPDSGSLIALKLVALDRDPDLLQGEQRGAELQQRIHQLAPAVAEVREIGKADGYLYIAMEYISGPRLTTVLAKRKRLREGLAVYIARQVCELLKTFHDAGSKLPNQEGPLIHGDIKPDNIHLQGKARVRLLDFGLAQRLTRHRASAVSVFGSLPYASPERLRDGLLNPAADLWGVGVLLYEMLAGAHPFPGATDEEIRQRILGGRGPEPLPSDTTPALAHLVRSCLDPDPRRRYPSAWALYAALDRLPISPARDVSKTRRLPGPDRTSGDKTASRTEAPKAKEGPQATKAPRTTYVPPRKRAPKRWWLGAALAGLVVTLVGAELTASSTCQQIEEALTSGEARNLTELAADYVTGTRWDLFSLFRSTGRRLEEELLASAETNIQAHRRGEEPDWTEAVHHLSWARRVDGDDDDERARYLYCQGQLAYQKALKYARQGNSSEAERNRVQAEQHFHTAEDLAIEWGGPPLALVRLYLHTDFGVPDADTLLEKLHKGQARERRLTDAEHRLLIEGYEWLGKAQETQALQVEDKKEKSRDLQSARRYFEEALDHCKELRSGNGACTVRFEQRIQQLRGHLRNLGYLS